MYTTNRRVATIRKVGWLAVASMLALAVLAPSAAPALGASFNGAIWTSLSNGTTVNANLYSNKSDVYLNGGPQNCGNSNGLPDGDYYFQVTDPSGATLLSSDAIKYRQIKVVNGVITGVSGAGNHLEGTTNCVGGIPVQLMPYADTPNNGGEYSVDMAAVADVADCPGYSADSTTLNFLACASSKNDNFKVGATVTPAPTPVITPAPTPVITPAPTPFQSVAGETGTPSVTLPPTDSFRSTGGGSDNWRMVLVAMAALLASVLVLTPARAPVRRR